MKKTIKFLHLFLLFCSGFLLVGFTFEKTNLSLNEILISNDDLVNSNYYCKLVDEDDLCVGRRVILHKDLTYYLILERSQLNDYYIYGYDNNNNLYYSKLNNRKQISLNNKIIYRVKAVN